MLRAIVAPAVLPHTQSVHESATAIDEGRVHAPAAAVADPFDRLRDLVLDPSIEPVLTFDLPRV